jgi:hypothetical protein
VADVVDREMVTYPYALARRKAPSTIYDPEVLEEVVEGEFELVLHAVVGI